MPTLCYSVLSGPMSRKRQASCSHLTMIRKPLSSMPFNWTRRREKPCNCRRVRIAEIEIVPEYLEQYNAILKEQSSQSLKIEPGVISIFPMYQKDNPTVLRLIEIYASKSAYESYIKSDHFQEYKTSTLKMVRSLKLVEMGAINPEAMTLIFEKLK